MRKYFWKLKMERFIFLLKAKVANKLNQKRHSKRILLFQEKAVISERYILCLERGSNYKTHTHTHTHTHTQRRRRRRREKETQALVKNQLFDLLEQTMSQHKIILEWLRRELRVQSLLKASNANTCWPLRMFSIAHWLWKLKGKSSLLVSKKLKKRYHRHVPHTWRNKSVKIGKKNQFYHLFEQKTS